MTSTASVAEPVTVVVTRRVRAGHDAAYEAWLTRLLEDARGLRGYLGATVHRPAANGPRDYTSVFRFDSVESLRAFETSELRARALRHVVPHVEADAAWRTLTGLEMWMPPPAGAVVPQPSRLRMALLLVAVVYALVLSIGSLVGLVLGDVAYPLRLLVTIVIEVGLMTWVLMPPLTRRLAGWLYPVAKG
ncbi:MAG: antibiotic biosynthesis monooxygenase [Gemmatimonadaceae bacterium]|nr:antibiotic biosynthesis monooxygenase [Gemmatimonadaceae bacterium]